MSFRPYILPSVLCGLLLFLMILHLNGGDFALNFGKIWNSLFHFSADNQSDIIYREIRVPRTVMAILAGASLSIAGLLMQTLFNNPLAGPSVLGITSGSSLFVAVTVLTGISFFNSEWGMVTASLVGAVVFSLVILGFSLFVKSHISLLLIGMMLGSFSGALIQVLQTSSQASQLKVFTLWGFGSVQHLSFAQIPTVMSVFLVGVFSLGFLLKPLNLLVIGEKSTQLLGIKTTTFRIWIIVVTSLFTGLVTAYCGPISFIGLAVPNMVRLLYKTQNHFKLLLGCAFVGAITLLFCDLLILWIEPWFNLPLNGITALFGAPVVIWIILKKF